MILGGGADHRGPADIDILDGVFKAAIGIGDCLLKRVQVDDDQIDRLDLVLLHHRVIDSTPAEYAAMHLWVQGLDSSRHHFRKAGVIGDLGYRYALLGDQFGGAAGGQQFDIVSPQGLRQFDNAGFVRNAYQRSADGLGHDGSW